MTSQAIFFFTKLKKFADYSKNYEYLVSKNNYTHISMY